MLCTGLTEASFAVLGGFRRRYHVDDIARNDEFCKILIERIDHFMYAVEKGSWDAFGAPIDGSKATAEALRRLYREPSGETIALDDTALEQAHDWSSVKEQIKLLKDREKWLNNQLTATLGSATYGALPDGSTLSLRIHKGWTSMVTHPDTRVLKHHPPKSRGKHR
jgi:predicted phage-related endonuclease